jgi:hypothetical protein
VDRAVARVDGRTCPISAPLSVAPRPCSLSDENSPATFQDVSGDSSPTFFANHLGQFEFNTQVLSSYVSGDDLIDASSCLCQPSSIDRLPASRQCAPSDGRASARRPSLRLISPRDQLRVRIGMRKSTGRAPPRTGADPRRDRFVLFKRGNRQLGDESETIVRHRSRPEPASRML